MRGAKFSMCQAMRNIKYAYQEIHNKLLKGQIKWVCHGTLESKCLDTAYLWWSSITEVNIKTYHEKIQPILK